MNKNPIHITDDEFDNIVLKSQAPVLVDFWAEWCGPCKMIEPILEEIADEYQGRLTVAKINVDENQSVPKQFAVRGIPTLILFKDGKMVETKVGAMSKAQLGAFLDSHVSAADDS
ncbi:MAG: thioredoxin TrxA [Candidatus Porifericomitaceae bacterium WSBS_2022_MAG_OTU9]